jgi:hypothetical protein
MSDLFERISFAAMFVAAGESPAYRDLDRYVALARKNGMKEHQIERAVRDGVRLVEALGLPGHPVTVI